MNIRNVRFVVLCMATVFLVSFGTGGLSSSEVDDHPAQEASDDATDAINLTGIHDPRSLTYDENCLGCHASILTQSSSDPRILPFHQAMIPYTPGYNAHKGTQNKNCVTCHRDAIDFRQESGSSLRRTVSIESCAYCHGPSGPGPVYYR